jgi:2-keto-4-pentenoate hydratase
MEGHFTMSETSSRMRAFSDQEYIAEQLVRARLDARVLTEYPGVIPTDFGAAYRCQDAAIARWPEPVGGWKVSMFLSAVQQAECGEERLIGPAFVSSIRSVAPGQVIDCPVIPGGFPGVEPEIVIRVARDAPPDKVDWTIEEASEMVGELCIGVEVVSSTLSKAVTPTLPVVVSDFGFNFGIVVGESISGWRGLKELTAQCFIDGELAARGVTPMRDRSGPLAALGFVLSKCARRGRPLRAGATIATGTITRYHALLPGQSARLVFEGIGDVLCRAVQETPRSHE